jgi:acyl-CoA thioester hydrolase
MTFAAVQVDSAAVVTPLAAMRYDVAYADTDAGGIVYHARYVEMAERSRNAAMAALGVPVQHMRARFGVQFLIREVRAVCHRPSFVGDTLELPSGIVFASVARVVWRTAIGRDGEAVCDVEAQIAAFDPASGGPCLMPDALMALLAQAPRMEAVRRNPMTRASL